MFLEAFGRGCLDPRSTLSLLVFFAVTFALAWSGIELSQAHGIAAIWLADAIVLVALIRTPKRRWWIYVGLALIAYFLGNQLHRNDAFISLVLSSCNLTSLLVSAYLLSRTWVEAPQLSQRRTLIEFCVLGGCLAPFISATMATLFLWGLYGVDAAPLWRTWFLACALGILSLGPLFLSVRPHRLRNLARGPVVPRVVAVVVLIIVVDAAAFLLDDQAYAFLVFPALLLGAFRLRFAGMTMMALVTVMIALGMTVAGYGAFQPDGERNLAEQVQLLQLLLAGAILTTLPVASALAERERLQRQLLDAVDEARNASRAKSEFLASMSHELRTPLNAVIGFAQLMLLDKAAISERQSEYLGYILRSGNQLLALVNDVLDFAKIESGDVRMDITAVDAQALLNEAAEILKPLAAERHLDLVVVQTHEGATVLADRARLMQILLNLGSNAIKYNRPRGSVRMGARLFGEAAVRITVADTGIGIPAQRQREVFQPFNRLGAEAGPIEGTGIGLSICWRLVHLMGGHIGFASERGQGSEFWVDLPKCLDGRDGATSQKPFKRFQLTPAPGRPFIG